MTVSAEESLKKHLDAVDRLERKFKFTRAFAAVVAVFIYGSFFYLSSKRADLYLVLTYLLLAITMQVALVTQVLHLHVATMTNRVLKAIELAARESKD